jgi:4-oxalocrotonate tautomerase
MPLIEVHLIENVFNPEQKRQIIQKLTDAMVSIDGENMRGVTWVKISEVTSDEWGHRRPAVDYRSRQGSRSRTKGGVRPVRCLALPGGSSPH